MLTATGGFQSLFGNGLNLPGIPDITANGINNAGQVAECASSRISSGGGIAFTFDTASSTYSVLPDLPGATGECMQDIDYQGVIVGNYNDVAGTHGFTATPLATAVPEPATLLLLGAGLTGAGLCRRLRRG